MYHIYIESNELSSLDSHKKYGNIHLYRQLGYSFNEDCLYLLILAVPNNFHVYDLCRLTNISLSELGYYEHYDIFQHKSSQQSLLLKFLDSAHVKRCFEHCNGKLFEKRYHQVCYALPVLSLHISPPDLLPDINLFSLDSYFELPTCPMCLERLDTSISGIVLRFCGEHYHNTHCISRWDTISCMACQTLRSPSPNPLSRESSTNSSLFNLCNNPKDRLSPECFTSLSCQECTENPQDISIQTSTLSMPDTNIESLWICLICHHIGCGRSTIIISLLIHCRYNHSHAVGHYQNLGHRFALELQNQYIWDYQSDGYIHRLLLGRSEESMVVFDDFNQPEKKDEDLESELINIKIETIVSEYNRMLYQHLSEQFNYFQNKMNQTESEYQSQIDHLLSDAQISLNEQKHLEENLGELEKQSKNLLRKKEKLYQRLLKVQDNTQFYRDLNQNLLSNSKEYQSIIKDLENKQHLKVDKQLIDKDKQIEELKSRVVLLMKELDKRNALSMDTSKKSLKKKK